MSRLPIPILPLLFIGYCNNLYFHFYFYFYFYFYPDIQCVVSCRISLRIYSGIQELMRVCHDYLGLTELTGQATGTSATGMFDSGITTRRNDIDGSMDTETEANNKTATGATTEFDGITKSSGNGNGNSNSNSNSKNYDYTTSKNSVGGGDEGVGHNQAGFSVIAAIFELIKGGMYSSGKDGGTYSR